MARYGGQRHRGSGNGARKGDGRTTNELFEFKRTDKTQITLHKRDLDKISAEASLTGRVPVVVLEIRGKSYVVIEESDWIAYRDGS